MRNGPGTTRLWITAGVLVVSLILVNTVSHGETVIPRQPLLDLPYSLGEWQGQEKPLPADTLRAVGVTDYANRLYVRQDSTPIQTYIGYYASQRTGDTIHSPKNCLPGAGWDPIRAGYTTIVVVPERRITVNEYLIQQDQNRQLVFYWYQGRGRIIASEYWGKFWMIADAIALNRTDSALVRLNTPIHDSEHEARSRLISFTELLFPYLEQLIPN